MEIQWCTTLYTVVIGLCSIAILGYLWLKRAHGYWERRGIPHVKATSLIFGNLKEVLYDKKIHAFEHYEAIYKKFNNEPCCGLFEFQYPVLMVRDPQLIQTVLVEKFNSFQLPKFTINENADEMIRYNPFVLSGVRWKETKSMLSIGLTQNKLRVLEDIVKTVSQDFYKYIDNNPDDIELHSLSSCYTSEMVANFGWGIRSDGFSQDSTIKKMFDLVQFASNFAFIMMFLNPLVSRLLNLKFYPKNLVNFFKEITKQSVDNLENSKNSQHTFLQTVLNGREKYRNSGKDMSTTEIAAHMSTFFLDGYETTARVLSLILYSLLLFPDMQRKMKEEILSIGEEITVESVHKLQYMEMFISEVFRYYPLMPVLGRICNEDCKFGNVEIKKGEFVIVPIHALHKDPNYYQDPDTFNPENFSEENKSKRPKFTFINFGGGPRLCLGMRYANATMKLFLCYLLRNYDIVPPKNHALHSLEPHPDSFIFVPKEPMYVGFKKTKL